MKHNLKIGPAVPFIHDPRHEVVGDYNARTVLIGRPTQEPNRIHFKSIRQFYIPKTKIYNLQPHFVRSSQENNASMSLSEKSCTLLHTVFGLPANIINIDLLSLSLKLGCSLKIIKGLIACSMQQRSASGYFDPYIFQLVSPSLRFNMGCVSFRCSSPRHSAIAYQCSYLLSSCFTLLLSKCCKLNLVIRNILLRST